MAKIEIDISLSVCLETYDLSLSDLWHKSNKEENTLVVLSLFLW